MGLTLLRADEHYLRQTNDKKALKVCKHHTEHRRLLEWTAWHVVHIHRQIVEGRSDSELNYGARH
jgi:hypothetical protein